VAALGVDAADREREQGLIGKPEPPGADEHEPVNELLLGEDPVHPAEPDLEWQRRVVGEGERTGAGAPFRPRRS